MENYELRRVQETADGASFSIVIPMKIVKNLKIDKGDYLKIHREGNRLVAEKV